MPQAGMPPGTLRPDDGRLVRGRRSRLRIRKAARDLYGCEGVYLPIQTDPWGRSTPESHGWAVWIGAGAWLAQHFWWHYEYGQDETFLRERAYPFLKEVASFFETYLVEDAETGTLHFVPSQSPENRFL